MLRFKIVSDSMTPLISVGSEIKIEKIGIQTEFKKFDILLFRQGERLVCHYFWHQNEVIDRGFITTRCLKDGKLDHPFAREMIIGRVVNFEIGFWLKLKIRLRDLWK